LGVGVGRVLGVLTGLFGGPDELHLLGEFLAGAVVGVLVERLGDPVISGMPTGEAGGSRGVGELRLDRAPFLGPLAEQPFGVPDVGSGDGPVGVPADPKRGCDLLGPLLEQAPRHGSLLFGGVGRGAGGVDLFAQRSQDAFVVVFTWPSSPEPGPGRKVSVGVLARRS